MSEIKKAPKPIKPIRIPRILCPNPSIENHVQTTANFDPSEFHPNHLVNATGQFGYANINKVFLHTFDWKPKHKCCQVLKAKIQVKMKSLSKGKSLTSSDAGNDTIHLLKNGGVNIIPGEKIYTGHPFGPGKLATKNWILSGSQLSWLNSHHKLSFLVQDDTSVLSIKIQLWICCLTPPRKEETPHQK